MKQAAQAAKNQQSAAVASRLDNPINSPSVTKTINTQSAQIADRLNSGTYAANTGRQAAIVQQAKDYKSAQAAANLDNSLMGQATRDENIRRLNSAMEGLYARMEGYRNNGQTEELARSERQYQLLGDRLAENKAAGGSLEDASKWEQRQYDRIIQAGGEELMEQLGQLARLKATVDQENQANQFSEILKAPSKAWYEYQQRVAALREQYGDEAADWLAYAERIQNASDSQALNQKLQQAGKDMPVLTSGLSVGTNLISGLGTLDVAAQRLGKAITGSDIPIDYNRAAQRPAQVTSNIRQGVSEDMGGVGRFLYNTGMSMLDSASVMASGGAGMALLGGAAATSAMQEAVQRGATDDQALLTGLVAGGMEAVMEKASIDSLFDLKTAKNAKDVVLNILKQSGAEGTEEALTTIANTIADAIIMGDESQLETRKRELEAQGYSEQQAERMAMKEWGQSLALDAAGGALSGGVFGSIKTGVDGIMPKLQREQVAATPVNVDGIMPKAQTAPTATESAPVQPVQTQTEPSAPVESSDNGIRVYRGYNRSMDGTERNLSYNRSINDVLGRTVHPDAELLPFVYYTDSFQDAENYANMDYNFLESLKERYGESEGLKSYKTLTGKEVPNKGTVLEHWINPKKVLDLTSLGEETTVGDVYRLLSQETGLPETSLHEDNLDSRLLLMGVDPEENGFQPFKMLRNEPVVNVDHGTRFFKFLKDFGYDAVRYRENGATHHAVITEQKKAPSASVDDVMPNINQEVEIGNLSYEEAAAKEADLFKALDMAEQKSDQKEVERIRAELDKLRDNVVGGDQLIDYIPNPPENVNGGNPAMGAADSGFDPYTHASIEHGAIEPGENPARVVDVPKSMDGESKVMQTVRTIMEADATPDTAIPELENAVVKGKFSRMPITDQAAADQAEAQIRRVGYQQALADWRNEVRSGMVGKNSVAVGEALYNAAVNAGDMKSAVKIAVDLSNQVRSAAQALQAVRMLKKMSPSAQLYGIKQSVDNLQKTLADRYGYRAPNLTINENLAAQFLQAETDDARAAAEEALYKDIARQVPATFSDKWNAWRYLSMLGNPRTHIRNILGNAMFSPVRFTKNKLGAAMEAGAQAVGLIDKRQRTKALGAAGKELMDAAREDYHNVESKILSGDKYNSASNIIDQNRRIYKFTALETLRKGNSRLLELEDSFFTKQAYASSLASYLKAQGYTAADFTGNGMTRAQKDTARSYAILEAQKATYRDLNALSELVTSIGFHSPNNSKTKGGAAAKKLTNAVLEGVLPFKKTPANILARAMEYSPAGLAKALTVDSVQVARGKITAAEYMDHLASGLTGSGLFALGYFLSKAGLLVGSPEDKEQADLEGRQPYALEIGDTSVTMDWLAPEAMPVFMGVELAEALAERNGEAVSMETIKSFFRGITGPVLEMSMMSGLQDALDAVSYADDKMTAVAANAALGYLSQALPTLFGQIERTFGKNAGIRQTTFTQEGRFLDKDTQYALGNLTNKFPFEYSQVPYIDAWGKTEETGEAGTRLFNNMLNPAYVSTIQETAVDREIKRLEEALGENLTPARAEKILTINKEKIILTADEYVTYAQAKGQNDLTFRQKLIDSDVYQGLDDKTKAKAMEYSRELANVLAMQEAGFEPDLSDWQAELTGADADTITNALITKAVDSQAGLSEGGKYAGLGDMLESGVIDDQLALSLLPESTLDSYLQYGQKSGVPVSDLMDVISYKNSAESAGIKDKNGKDIKGETRQDHVREYIAGLDLTRTQKRGLWCSIYAESTCPW